MLFKSLLIVLGLLFLCFITDYMGLIYKAPLKVFALFSFYNLAGMFVLAVPVAVFISAILIFGRPKIYQNINPDKNYRFRYFLIAPFLGCLILCIGMCYFNFQLLPKANYKARIQYKEMRDYLGPSAVEKIMTYNGYWFEDEKNSRELQAINKEADIEYKFWYDNAFERLEIHGYILKKEKRVVDKLNNGVAFAEDDFEWLPVSGVETKEEMKDFIDRINDNSYKIYILHRLRDKIRFIYHRKVALTVSVMGLFLLGMFSGLVFYGNRTAGLLVVFLVFIFSALLYKIAGFLIYDSLSLSLFALWVPVCLVFMAALVLLPLAQKRYDGIIINSQQNYLMIDN